MDELQAVIVALAGMGSNLLLYLQLSKKHAVEMLVKQNEAESARVVALEEADKKFKAQFEQLNSTMANFQTLIIDRLNVIGQRLDTLEGGKDV